MIVYGSSETEGEDFELIMHNDVLSELGEKPVVRDCILDWELERRAPFDLSSFLCHRLITQLR